MGEGSVHHRSDFANLLYGVLTARRAGLARQRCINTWPADALHSWLRSKGGGGRGG